MSNPVPLVSKKLGMTLIGDENQYARIDTTNGALLITENAHRLIHAGRLWHLEYYAASKNDGETINLYFKTPNTTALFHCYAQWSSGGGVIYRVYEAPTITSNTGTHAKLPINHNRNSLNTMTILDNATAPAVGKYSVDVTKTGDGTIINTEYSGSGKQIAGGGRANEEFLLASNKVYLFEVESDAAGIFLNIDLVIYETPDLAELTLVT